MGVDDWRRNRLVHFAAPTVSSDKQLLKMTSYTRQLLIGTTATVLVVGLTLNVRPVAGAVAMGHASVSQDHPGKCMDDATSQPYSLSASWQMNDACGMKRCVERANNLYMSYETCGYTQAPASCHIVEDLNLKFPDCCPKVICPPDENQINTDEYEYDVTDIEAEGVDFLRTI